MNKHIFLLVFFGLLFYQIAFTQDKQIIIRNESAINTGKLEFSPSFYKGGIVYTSTNVPGLKYRAIDTKIEKNTMSLYYAKRGQNTILTKPAPFAKQLNTKFHEGTVSFNRADSILYFSRNNYLHKKKHKASDGELKMKIYQAKFVGGAWGMIEELPFNDDEYNTTHPSISADGKKMIFSSDRPGGFGGMDLYIVEKKGNEWGEPKNLGSYVNTPFNEVFPFLHDGGTLFFSTNGHSGVGGFDNYHAQLSDDNIVTDIKNLGDPFNTEFDDLSFVLSSDKKYGYFSSNRPGGKGEDDIYSFVVEGKSLAFDFTEKKDVKLIFLDAITNEPIEGVKVGLIDLNELRLSQVVGENEDGSLISVETLQSENNEVLVLLKLKEDDPVGYTDMNGEYNLSILNKEHLLKIEKEGYVPKDIILNKDNIIDEMIVLLDKGNDRVLFSGVLKDANGMPIAGQSIAVFDKSTGKETVLVTGPNGEYSYGLFPGHSYIVSTVLPNGEEVEQTINVEDTSPDGLSEITIELKAEEYTSNLMAEGTVIELPNIYYDYDKYNIRDDAERDLDLLASVLQKFPHLRIELSSHTDSRGKDSYNMELSKKRAESAVDYLMKWGISKDRLVPKGYGELQIRNKCINGVPCLEVQHQYNRRTEFKVIGGDSDINIVSVDSPPSGYSSSSDVVEEASGIGTDGVIYEVIAGTFRIQENAHRRLQKVKSLGYSGAKVKASDKNGYYYVIVSSFTSQDSATSLFDEILNQGVDCFVRKN